MDEDRCQEIAAVVGNENGQNIEDLIVSLHSIAFCNCEFSHFLSGKFCDHRAKTNFLPKRISS
jgi:hypothetical protein